MFRELYEDLFQRNVGETILMACEKINISLKLCSLRCLCEMITKDQVTHYCLPPNKHWKSLHLPRIRKHNDSN